jgi:adenosylmethionine-8-amino-7-oxononanoate aminotransferase
MSLTYTWLPADLPDSKSNCLHIASTSGSHLITHNGEKIFDAISSWWCKPLGHSHPLIINSIKNQLNYFEHHIPAKAWNNTIEGLSKKLVHIFTQMDKVMYASDGSSAVEIAMKLSYEARVLEGQAHRYKYIALAGAYHGETIFTLGVCGISNYKTNYQKLLLDNYFIENIPYTCGVQDPLWFECNFDHKYWNNFFAEVSLTSTALIIEPIVQGAAGMKIISRDFLIKIVSLAKLYDLHIIADEIMVGLGRLGCLSVSKEILNLEPDMVCFAKNLTAGSVPMSAVVINKAISQIFRKHKQAFHHSHTHSCNALAAAVANSYLDYLNNSDVLTQVKLAEAKLQEFMKRLKNSFSFIQQIRVIGAIAALELNLPTAINSNIFALAVNEQIYLRMIGNILYIMPPLYNIQIDIESIQAKLYSLLKKLSGM